MFEKLWQFSSYLVQKGIKIIEASYVDNVIDINITKAEEDKDHFILRANADGKPEYITQSIEGENYKAIRVGDKLYIPDKERKA